MIHLLTTPTQIHSKHSPNNPHKNGKGRNGLSSHPPKRGKVVMDYPPILLMPLNHTISTPQIKNLNTSQKGINQMLISGFLFYQLYIKRRGEFTFDVTGKDTSAYAVSPAQNIIRREFLSQLAKVIRDNSNGNIRFPEEGK